MSRSDNQKLKLPCLMKILLDHTDEEHPMTISDMIGELSRYGISAERKSLYDDLEALRRFGLDIECRKAKKTGYYVSSRTFELPELKLLADAVASAKFITEKKSSELIGKIESLTSVHQARQLGRQVYVLGRVKTSNEQIFYNVDAIHQAIAQNRQIEFRYYEYNLHKQKQYRRGGAPYKASPCALCWDDENYYMVAFYEKYENLSHFRVDKMEGISILEEPRVQMDGNFNPADYSRKIFGMFGGEEQRLCLCFDKSLIGVVLDRFGKNVTLLPSEEDTFTVHVDAFVSPTLIGWLFSFGDKVRVLSPESLASEMVQRAMNCLLTYGKARLKCEA